MIKTVREKLLENRIARLEKLLAKESKSVKNESLPHSGMTLGEIFEMILGTTGVLKTLRTIEQITDYHYTIADHAGLADEEEGLDFIEEHWGDPCRVDIRKGMGGGGSDDVRVTVAGITFGLDWLDEDEEDEEDYYESRGRKSSTKVESRRNRR